MAAIGDRYVVGTWAGRWAIYDLATDEPLRIKKNSRVWSDSDFKVVEDLCKLINKYGIDPKAKFTNTEELSKSQRIRFMNASRGKVMRKEKGQTKGDSAPMFRKCDVCGRMVKSDHSCT